MINLEHLQNLGDGDADFISDLLTVFLSETPTLLRQLTAGAQKQDWNQAALSIHQLKSNFALLGLEPLAQLSRRIEMDIKNQQSGVELAALVESLVQQTGTIYQPLEAFRDLL